MASQGEQSTLSPSHKHTHKDSFIDAPGAGPGQRVSWSICRISDLHSLIQKLVNSLTVLATTTSKGQGEERALEAGHAGLPEWEAEVWSLFLSL